MEKIILIFGAGTGIGREIFDVLVHKENDQSLIYGFSRSGQAYNDAFFPNQNHCFDMLKPENFVYFQNAFHHLIESLTANSKSIELIVYFAQGDGLFKPIEQIETQELSAHFQLNLFASMAILKIITPAIQKLKQSTIVFLSSTAGRLGFSESTAYCASKHAVAGLAKALREEWKPFGTKVVSAYLGAIATSIWDTRTDFSKNDMISVKEAGEFLASISYLPQTLYLDEIYVTPRKGIL
jgi:short-subunit dehydrogenase